MEKENLIFSSKTPNLEILIETCLFFQHHYGHFWILCPFIANIFLALPMWELTLLLDMSSESVGENLAHVILSKTSQIQTSFKKFC